MDELDKRAQKGLSEFNKKGSITDVKSSLDSMVDDMFDDPEDTGNIEPQPQEQGNAKKWLVITVLLLALASIAYLGYRDGSKAKPSEEVVHKTPQVLFAQYFEPMDDITIDISRGESNNKNSPEKGMELYNLKRYKAAAKILLTNTDVQSQFYGALSMLNAGDTDSAIPLLTKMQTTEDFKKYHDIIDWYTALAYLSVGDKKAAKNELLEISKNGKYKHTEARDILNSI